MNRHCLALLALPAAWLAAARASAAAASGAATAPLLFAAPSVHAATPGQAGSLLRVAGALLLVLAAILGAAWFSRRMHGVGSARHSALEVIAQLPLGPRERAVLVRVGSQQVLLGVASGNVRALHVLPLEAGAPAATGATADAATSAMMAAQIAQRPSFKSLLLRSLGK